MNRHLNVFRSYGLKGHIEDNLTRGLAICLQESEELLKEFLTMLEIPLPTETETLIDIQVECNGRSNENIKYLFGFTLTTDGLEGEIAQGRQFLEDRRHFADIFLQVGETVILIEAKRNNANCIDQLQGQMNVLKEGDWPQPAHLTWDKVLSVFQKVLDEALDQNTEGAAPRLLSDYLEYVRHQYPHWLKPKPFNTIKMSDEGARSTAFARLKELQTGALSKEVVGKEPLPYNDRVGWQVDYGWAKELLIVPAPHERPACLRFEIYPGNTKTQGRNLDYDQLMNVFENRVLRFSEMPAELSFAYHIRFSTAFGKYIQGLFFQDDELNAEYRLTGGHPLYSQSAFNRYAGSWSRSDSAMGFEHNGIHLREWEELLDKAFRKDWKDHCQWNEKFINHHRLRFTIAMGLEVSLTFPWHTVKMMDGESDSSQLQNLVIEVDRYVAELLG